MINNGEVKALEDGRKVLRQQGAPSLSVFLGAVIGAHCDCLIHVLKTDTMVNIYGDVIHWWYVCRETVTVFGSHAGIENRKLLGVCE